ncbi:integrase core domain-containing protein [Trueperella pyogenes]
MPWHNGFVDSFHNRLRDKLLEDEMFETLPMRRAACDCGRSAIIPSFEPRVYPAD